MTLDEMEAQAHRALDGMKVNITVMANNQLRLIALVRNARAAADKKPAETGKDPFPGFTEAFADVVGQARGGQS
jgi:hypothetical protein